MKAILLLAVLCTVLTSMVSANPDCSLDSQIVKVDPGFRAYLNQHEIVYRRPPRGGHDGMPIGNRVMAGMVYSDGGDYKILLAKDDLWDHRTLDYEITHHGLTHTKVLEKLEAGEADSLTTIPRNRFAEFWGERPLQRAPGWMPYPAPKVASWITVRTRDQQFIVQRLRLSNATVQTQFDKLRLRAHIPVGSDKNVLVLRIEPDGRQDLEIEIARPADPILETSPVFSIQDGRLQLRYEFPDGFSYAMAFRIADATPSITLAGESATLKCTGAKPVTLLASISTSRDGPNPTADAVRQLQEFDPVDARTRHDSYWKDFWSKSRIQLGDKFIENLWYFGLYQAGASFSPRYSGMALVMTINEMLMQSHRGSIRVFPAVPDNLVSGFDGLRARDGFLVSARRTAEGVQWVEIVAQRADVVRVDNPWPGEAAQLSLNGKIQRTVQDEQAIDVPMAAGQRLTLVPAGQTVTANVWPPTESTGPRRTIRTLREGLPPGVRNDPIRPRSKVAERCELWLGTPGTEHRILNKE